MWKFWQLVQIKIAPWYSRQHALLTNQSPHLYYRPELCRALFSCGKISRLSHNHCRFSKQMKYIFASVFHQTQTALIYFGSELLSRKRHPVLVLPCATGDIYMGYNSFHFFMLYRIRRIILPPLFTAERQP